MHAFVDDMLRRLSAVKGDADIEATLGELADILGYRSAFIMDFPSDGSAPIRMWDSKEKRGFWWRNYTDHGRRSIVRTRSEGATRDGVHSYRVPEDDPIYSMAVAHDFHVGTLVPISFEQQTRGIACFSGDIEQDAEGAIALRIVCYALLMQARMIMSATATPEITLTPRERQVMELTAQGLTSEMVADRLGMSARTVNQHFDNISGKLKTRNRVHAVAEAIRRGLLA